MVSKSIFDPDAMLVLFDHIGGVCLFGLTIPRDITRTLCPYGKCLSHHTSNIRESP